MLPLTLTQHDHVILMRTAVRSILATLATNAYFAYIEYNHYIEYIAYIDYIDYQSAVISDHMLITN